MGITVDVAQSKTAKNNIGATCCNINLPLYIFHRVGAAFHTHSDNR